MKFVILKLNKNLYLMLFNHQPTKINKFAFFQMQGFGDLVILCNILKNYTINNENNFIIMGSYLTNLFNELSLDIKTIIYKLDGEDIPPIYNLKNDGIIKGYFNGLEIRNLLSNNYKEEIFYLIFDYGQVNYGGIRERFFSFNLPKIFIEAKQNVYLTYIDFLKEKNNFKHIPQTNDSGINNKIVSIFPSSRQKRKVIPENILNILIHKSKKLGLIPKIYDVGNENQYSEDINKYAKILPKTFKSVIKAINNSSMVISSDSVAAHIAEFYKKPIYVFSPIRNNYWLPLSSYENKFSSEFNNFRSNTESLEKFFFLYM